MGNDFIAHCVSTWRAWSSRPVASTAARSAVISAWRDQRDKGALEAMRASRPGPKADATKAELARLRAKVTDLEDKLATAEELIEAQGKASALLQAMRRKSADPAS